MSAQRPRHPAAFRLDDVRFADGDDQSSPKVRGKPTVTATPDPFATEAAGEVAAAPSPPQPRTHWARLLAVAVGGLLSLAVGLGVDQLIRALFDRESWLGWIGAVLVALGVLAVLAIAIREVVGLLRLSRINLIHAEAVRAVSADDRKLAIAAASQLIALYQARPETARGRSALTAHLREIIDGRDLIGLAETELLLAFDETARRIVLSSAKRVSLVTAISPRALIDVLFVLAEILRLIRRLAALYGGRPGFFGFFRLTRSVLGHLALTGGMAAGDSLLQQILGHGIAARLSARLGEGVINGLLTARVGIAAIEVCRPLPFVTGRPPRLGDIMGELTKTVGRKQPDDQAPTAG